MVNLEAIWAQAESDLVVEFGRGRRDVFLWEHSARVARSASLIVNAPEVAGRNVDLAALSAAALYFDSGWVVQYRDKIVTRAEILGRATSDLQRELGAALLEERLRRFLEERSLETATLAVRRMNDREATLPEAQILGDAANLDEIGVLSFWQTVRRNSNEGKGVQAAIDTWRRQQEYHFWEARIADAFRFESVRKLARRRLERFGEFMEELERQLRGEDVATLSGTEIASKLERLPGA